ncbi:putative transcriptional regulator [Desulfosporosinus acidiphilus SJ4]|uniref:Putative transcriptional regulator n=1 Tax=Desulfosporosinus acidiphilus (strain DSM 22704 / JCM 16185 / SJ4) TaxID=646529 RepID=I4D5Q7_DESAJ|nr:helix-turn-helix domain-containing protein [Desulfosporosinus acidiphilus]AFM41131.1 putative transcriptional regulator [Desulfosporosinus acidiphilus SJ4]
MTKDEFIKNLDQKLKLIRTEFNYSQDKMAEILGVSKKTLVQIEKGRSTLGWMGAVTLCTIFEKSEILTLMFGGQPKEVILAFAFNSTEQDYPKTLGGRVWWEEVEASFGYKLQKNLITQHYRILDSQDRRICSSFELDQMNKRLKELVEHEGI